MTGIKFANFLKVISKIRQINLLGQYSQKIKKLRLKNTIKPNY